MRDKGYLLPYSVIGCHKKASLVRNNHLATFAVDKTNVSKESLAKFCIIIFLTSNYEFIKLQNTNKKNFYKYSEKLK
jgi:hypothetical protein